MENAKRKLPPSRGRYEESHPVIAIRVDRATAERLRALSRQTGKSLGALIKENLGVQERVEAPPKVFCLLCQTAYSEDDVFCICKKCAAESDPGEISEWIDAYFGRA